MVARWTPPGYARATVNVRMLAAAGAVITDWWDYDGLGPGAIERGEAMVTVDGLSLFLCREDLAHELFRGSCLAAKPKEDAACPST